MANNSSDQQLMEALSQLLQASIPAPDQNLTDRTAQLTTYLAPVTMTTAASIPETNRTSVPGSSVTGGGANSNSVPEEMLRLSGQLTLLRQVNELNQEVLNANTQALQHSASTQGQVPGNTALDTAKSIGSFLLGGLGIGSLISGISGLIGGGSQDTPAPLVKYSPPAALQYQGAIMSTGVINNYDYNDRGGLRPIESSNASQSPPTTTQIVVNVNAMDSKSFMDHSDEIAQAVRAAMLNSSSINDVIAEM